MVFFFKKKYNAQITVTSKRKINFMIFSSSLFRQCKICRNKFVIRTVFYIEEETNLKKNGTFVNYWPFQLTKIVKKQKKMLQINDLTQWQKGQAFGTVGALWWILRQK